MATLVGCSDKPTLATVEGTVTYKGKALSQGIITFVPEKGRAATGTITDGAITNVTCFEPNDGVPVGPAKVGIRSFVEGDAKTSAPTRYLIPEFYGNPEKSKLKADIKPGKNVLKFDLD